LSEIVVVKSRVQYPEMLCLLFFLHVW